jgi:DHA2 family multidrug resistance protein
MSPYDPPMQDALTRLHGLGLSDSSALAVLYRQLTEQSYLLASLDYFWVSAWLSLAVLLLVWLAKRPSGGAAPAAAD